MGRFIREIIGIGEVSSLIFRDDVYEIITVGLFWANTNDVFEFGACWAFCPSMLDGLDLPPLGCVG